jgi:hypothetical protein
MSVGHFHIYSVMGDARTREVARQLQAFEKTVGEFLRSDDRLPEVPTVIYILGAKDFLRYGAGRPGLAGVFYERPYTNVITINEPGKCRPGMWKATPSCSAGAGAFTVV